MEKRDMTKPSDMSAGPGRKYRILLVVRWPVGGIRTFIRYVYSRFETDKFHFSILGPDIPELDTLLEELPGMDIELIKLSQRPTTREFLLSIMRVVIHGKFDLIHSHGFTSGICASLPAFLARRSHILTSHDVLNQKQFIGISGKIKRIGMSITLSMIQLIHSVSKDAQENLLEFFPRFRNIPGKCVVIPNGIEMKRFLEIQPRKLRKELEVDDSTFLIGFLGRFMAQKGFKYLVDAIEELVKVDNLPKKFLVVSFGEDGFVREEKAQIEDKGLENFFRFLPFTMNIAGAVKALDVVVMPSLWEACPLLPMEVFVCGTPLIATGCIGLREVIAGTPARTIKPKDSSGLARAICEEMVDENSKIRSKHFVEHAKLRFSVEQQAQKIYETYLYLMDGYNL